MESTEKAAEKVPEKAPENEDLSKYTEELGIPADKKLISEVLDLMKGPALASCDTRRQSPWVSESDPENTCDLDLAGLYPQVKNSVAQVLARADGTVLFGTAFKYCEQSAGSKCYYVTNAHVIGSSQNPGIVSEDGRTVQYSKLLARDGFKDLALIEVPESDSRPAVKLAAESPEKGESVFTIGHPYGFPKQVLSAGKVTYTEVGVQKEYPPQSGKLVVQDDLLASSVSVLQGNSGGPEFNKNGELVGVKVIALENGGSLSIKAGEIIDLIERYDNYRKNQKSS